MNNKNCTVLNRGKGRKGTMRYKYIVNQEVLRITSAVYRSLKNHMKLRGIIKW